MIPILYICFALLKNMCVFEITINYFKIFVTYILMGSVSEDFPKCSEVESQTVGALWLEYLKRERTGQKCRVAKELRNMS